jgi:hypothetical protein
MQYQTPFFKFYADFNCYGTLFNQFVFKNDERDFARISLNLSTIKKHTFHNCILELSYCNYLQLTMIRLKYSSLIFYLYFMFAYLFSLIFKRFYSVLEIKFFTNFHIDIFKIVYFTVLLEL